MSTEENLFPLLELPILVLEKVVSFINNPFDIKALRRTCKELKSIIDKNPEILINLKLIVCDLNGLQNLVESDHARVHWNNIQFPPELLRVGSRRHYVEKFNNLLETFTDYAGRIRKLDLNHLNLSNPNYVNLLKACQKLETLKVDTMIVNGMKEQELMQILDDSHISKVLNNLTHLDITAFEFLKEDYHFAFMGKLLQKCRKLEILGSWGYFPEWEQPVGGTVHLKYFLWPLFTFLKGKFEIVGLVLESIQSPDDLGQLNLQYLNDSMDWQSSKWMLDLRNCTPSDNSCLEKFLFSRITSYIHRAVGWFDESDYKKAGLSLMTNLEKIRIHNARDIKLTGENPYRGNLFPKLKNLTLVVGNRTPCLEEENVLLEKVIVQMLLNSRRCTVQNLTLDIDLNHHHQLGSIDLPRVISNFPNLTSFCVEEWGPNDEQIGVIFDSFPLLETLMFCGRNVSDVGLIGAQESDNHQGIQKLKKLKILKILSVRLPPKNVFPWPIKENHSITDISFKDCFSKMLLRKFHFLLQSDTITKYALECLLGGEFSKSATEFVMNWLPNGVDSTNEFYQMHESFKFLDPQAFLEPANFVIPDIGRWVL